MVVLVEGFAEGSSELLDFGLEFADFGGGLLGGGGGWKRGVVAFGVAIGLLWVVFDVSDGDGEMVAHE